jgi:ribosomal protein L40E
MSSMYPPRGGPTVQSCMRCGLPLLPDVPVCRNCGWYNALPPQQFADSVSMMPAQGQQAGYNGQALVQPGLYFAPPAAPGNTFQPATNLYAPGNYYQQPGPAQPPRKRGPNVVAVLLLIIALLLLIGGGSLAGYFFFFDNAGQNAPAVTPTTPIVTPSIQPIFSDNFQNNANKWNTTGIPGQYSVSVGGGQMVLEDDHNNVLWELLPGQAFSGFRLDVDAKLTKGDKRTATASISGALPPRG